VLADTVGAHGHLLSRTDRLIADYLLGHTDELPFLRAAEIAERLGVSAASVTRFAQRIGFDGYPRLQDAVRAELRSDLAPPALSGPGEGRYAALWERESRNLAALRALPEDVLDGAARRIAEAGTVWVIGGRASHPPAAGLAALLGRVRPGVRLLDPGALHEPEALLDLAAGDLLVAITFRRYSRSTARVGALFAAQDVPVLLITDDGHPSLAATAAAVLRVSPRAPGALLSTTAVTSLGLALALGVMGHTGTARLDHGEELGHTLDAFED
jgi:DNA-binding MurR/RpiR family transcriptional regulator